MSAELTWERRLGVVSVVAATAVALSLLLVSSAGADPVGDQFRISNQGPDGQAFTAELADIAYNPQTGQSLVVWLGSEAAAPETTFEIYGRLIDGNGNQVGGDFAISGDGHPEQEDRGEPPTVTYNPDDNEFLVVWNSEEGSGPIFVQRISAAGAELGADDLQVSSGTYDDNESSEVSYSPEADRYLVVWKAIGASGPQVYGRLLSRDGSPIGSDFAVSQQSGVVDNAISLAYNQRDQEWLPVWSRVGANTETEIYGQRLNTDATEDGPDDFRISDMGPDGHADFDAFPPRVAYNSVANEYLVTWTADDDTAPLVDGDYEVFGQRLAADGAEVGTNDFRISDMGFEPFRPDIAYNPNANEYLLTWHGDDNTPPLVDNELEIFGQRLAADGAEIGANDFRVSQLGPDGSNPPIFDNQRPALAYNSRTCDYVAAWSANPGTGELADDEFEIWGRRIAAPACAAPPAPPVPPAPTGPIPGRCANPRTGTDASETLNGTAFGDLISGLGGDDVINGLRGDDCLRGGSGRDRLSGAAGRDRLFGGPGRDRLSGASGRDRLSGDAANDRLWAGDGRDRLLGGPGNDLVRPGNGRDRAAAGAGNDRVVTRGGMRDTIDCGPGRDVAIVDRFDRTRRCEHVRRP